MRRQTRPLGGPRDGPTARARSVLRARRWVLRAASRATRASHDHHHDHDHDHQAPPLPAAEWNEPTRAVCRTLVVAPWWIGHRTLASRCCPRAVARGIGRTRSRSSRSAATAGRSPSSRVTPEATGREFAEETDRSAEATAGRGGRSSSSRAAPEEPPGTPRRGAEEPAKKRCGGSPKRGDGRGGGGARRRLARPLRHTARRSFRARRLGGANSNLKLGGGGGVHLTSRAPRPRQWGGRRRSRPGPQGRVAPP